MCDTKEKNKTFNELMSLVDHLKLTSDHYLKNLCEKISHCLEYGNGDIQGDYGLKIKLEMEFENYIVAKVEQHLRSIICLERFKDKFEKILNHYRFYKLSRLLTKKAFELKEKTYVIHRSSPFFHNSPLEVEKINQEP